MTLVAGIDVSTKAVDIVLLADDNTADWTHIGCADERGPFFAARKAAEFMPRGTFWDDVWLVGVEDPMSTGKMQAKALGLVTGAVAACLPPALGVVQTQPNEWQRVFLEIPRLPRKSVERKVLIARRCFDLGFGFSMETGDARDAFGIAWAVRAINDTAEAAA